MTDAEAIQHLQSQGYTVCDTRNMEPFDPTQSELWNIINCRFCMITAWARRLTVN